VFGRVAVLARFNGVFNLIDGMLFIRLEQVANFYDL